MATSNQQDLETTRRIAQEIAEEREFRGQLDELRNEDNFAGALPVLEQYPKVVTRELTEFERDLRDWGFTYGLTFGLALRAWADEPHVKTAERALTPALSLYRGWSGEIQDPGVRRENAIRRLAQVFEETDCYTLREGAIPRELLVAIEELADSARA
jgi:hypothetical protein